MSVNDTSDPGIRALLQRVEEYRRCYDLGDSKNFDRKKVEQLYKMDEDFQAYDIAPPLGGYAGWEAYAKGWSHVMDKYAFIQFKFRDDLRVNRRGEVGWSTVSADWSGRTRSGEEFSKEFRLTLVWVNDNGTWRITHEHGSSPKLHQLQGGGAV